jgi:hypothetical protein
MTPKCSGKCENCLFYYTNRCVAQQNDDYFVMINEKSAFLIINNQNRFHLSEKKIKALKESFPGIEKQNNSILRTKKMNESF